MILAIECYDPVVIRVLAVLILIISICLETPMTIYNGVFIRMRYGRGPGGIFPDRGWGSLYRIIFFI